MFIFHIYITIISVNGNFSAWTSWDSCSVSCGGGSQTKLRICNNPIPANGGDNCTREDGSLTNGAEAEIETQACNLERCPPGRYRIPLV